MKLNVLRNKKGSALLWCILLTIILTILLAAVNAAAYAYFNYTMYAIKRQQAYFTARSAANIVLENLSSVEQTKETTTSGTATSGGYSMNFDGNYIKDGNGDGVEDVVDGKGNIKYYGTNVDHNTFTSAYINSNNKYFDAAGYLIEDYTRTTWKGLIRKTENVKVRTSRVMQKTTSTGASYTSQSSEIDLLPVANSSITVSDFGFDTSMGTASAVIERDDKDQITVKITSYYPDAEKGEKYELNATVVRQPVYFGGIAVKNLTLNGNFKLGDGTDLYWNNTDEFNTAGNGSSFKVNGNGKLTIKGNLVTKGNATITPNNIVAGKKFLSTTNFTSDPLKQKKIWNSSQYIISNKTLLVGDSSTDYVSSTYGTISALFSGDVHPKYCNSRGGDTFGSIATEITSAVGFKSLLNLVGLGNAYDGLMDKNYALTNSENDAMAIQYIRILSLSNAINQYLDEQSNDVTSLFDVASSLFSSAALAVYNATIANYTYDTLDVSYIDYSSTDENTRSDEVVPLTYIIIPSGIQVRVKYGCNPGNRTQLGQAFEGIINSAESFLANAFDINSNAAYNVIYMEDGTNLEIGYKDGQRNNNGNRAADIFYYSVYGGDNTTVHIHKNCIVVGEVICENLIVEDGAQVIYSSTNGSQVAKQKIAEYWSVANYSD